MAPLPPSSELRQHLAFARRIVIKIGTRSIVQRNGRPDLPRLRALVKDVAALHRDGREVLVVTSGAIGAGMEALGMKTRPRTIPDLQMAAAVGQVRLMARYDQLFGAERCRIGQILLTHDGLKHRERHLNARNTIMNLLEHRIIPVINENDAVSVEEIKFGDNDLLGALVSVLVDADVLVLLTTVNGLLAPTAAGARRRLPFLEAVTPEALALAIGKGDPLSTGGMASKLQSAQVAADNGAAVVIANGRRAGILAEVFSGRDTGTLIAPRTLGQGASWDGRRKWIAWFHKVTGALVVDDGARAALEQRGRSLLAIGVRGVEGAFTAGSVVNIRTEDGTLIARGLTNYSAEDVRRIMGHPSSDIAGLLGAKDFDEIVLRDNMAVFHAAEGAVP